MCGIAGIVGTTPVAGRLYEALTVLQHRGQDAAGIVTSDGSRLHLRKELGLVSDVFRREHMLRLHGTVGIAHVRYPTAGTDSVAEAQPFYVNSPYGIALAHNGNLTNADALRDVLFRTDRRHLNTTSDSEVLLNVLAQELGREDSLDEDRIVDAIGRLHERCKGAYAVVALVMGEGLIAFRDPRGIRPLVYGRRLTDTGVEYMVASESVALDVLGFELLGDVAPGACVMIRPDGTLRVRETTAHHACTPCLFEYVYLARPDSMMDGISVYKTRLRMGDRLAEKILRERPDHDIDVVIPIPDTSRTAALQVAHALGVKFREGFIKNRYIGRTFIMPGQQARKRSVRRKLNPIGLEFRGKNVLLVDDSIVRGTTCQQIIEMAREAGARRVYFASAAPPVTHPNVYGIDMPAASELIASGRTVEEVQTLIGADWLVYQDLDALIACAREGNDAIQGFDTSVFDGQYVTGDVDADYLAQLGVHRSDAERERTRLVGDPDLDLQNDR